MLRLYTISYQPRYILDVTVLIIHIKCLKSWLLSIHDCNVFITHSSSSFVFLYLYLFGPRAHPSNRWKHWHRIISIKKRILSQLPLHLTTFVFLNEIRFPKINFIIQTIQNHSLIRLSISRHPFSVLKQCSPKHLQHKIHKLNTLNSVIISHGSQNK